MEYTKHRNQCINYRTCNRSATDHLLTYTDVNTAFSNYGSDDAFPTDWIYEVCPEVMQFYDKVPYFRHFDRLHRDVALTTEAAMSFTCLLRLIDVGCRRANATWSLYAGGSIGGALHGGPIPWDDDVDIIIDFDKKEAFMEAMQGITAGPYRLKCMQGYNAVKCYIPGIHLQTTREWEWPFVDIFFFESVPATGKMLEKGRRKLFIYRHTSLLQDYFPQRQYHYGGLLLPGPDVAGVSRRYKLDRCFTPWWYHRHESLTVAAELCCCDLRRKFPFVHRVESVVEKNMIIEILVIDDIPIFITKINKFTREVATAGYITFSDRGTSFTPQRQYVDPMSQYQLVLPASAWDKSFAKATWYTSKQQRLMWYNNEEKKKGQHFTRSLPNLATVEVVNSIAPQAEAKSVLRVINFNAERGKSWFAFAAKIRSDPRLRHADVIILNEMDIGMARSRNEHTTRMLAHALQMNYAFGVEFVELTNGDRDEQKATTGIDNELSLHGNAILSKYPISDAFIIRDELKDSFYSDRKTFDNANGFEKRLGGRMALFTTLQLRDDAQISVGSMHKITAQKYPEVVARLAEKQKKTSYMGAIVAGDQAFNACHGMGMKNMENPHQNTWPATCSSFGRVHGDIICSTLEVYSEAVTILPCYNTSYTLQHLSDHAIQVVELSVRL